MTEYERPPIAEGDVLVGRYRVERILGVGGMGVVVAATQIDLERRVAIKVLLPSALENAGALERFARESRALSRLTTEHVTRVLEVGELENGLPFLVMEFLEGTDLAALLFERGTLSVPIVVDLVRQACAGLSDAHENGIIHRDLKPSNLFLAMTPTGATRLKVLDFGISKILGPQAKVVTCDTEVLGSPLYMSPEQLCGTRGLDTRSDVWALGVVMYELLAGSVPFDGESFTEICARILHAPAPRLDAIRVDVPKGLADIVARCLVKDPKKRWQSVTDLAKALAAFDVDHSASARTTSKTKRASMFASPSTMRVVAALLGAASLAGLLEIAFEEEGTMPARTQHQAEIVSVKSAFFLTTADSAPVGPASPKIDVKAFTPPARRMSSVPRARRDEPDLGY
jgi:eukaryotic-like serine/threonine-protein kinase